MRLALLALSLAVATPAAAFVCTRAGSAGPSVAWKERSFELVPNARGGAEITPAELADSLDHAVAQWTQVGCSDLVITAGPATSGDRIGFDWAAGRGNPPNENIVVFRDGDDPVGRWLHPGSAVAITTVTFELTTGEIMDTDIEFNDIAFQFTDCLLDCQPVHDLKNTLTHEVGHALGLDHPPSNQPGALEATMFASTNAGDLEKRDLAQDDIDGLCAIYPAGGETGECYGVPRVEPVGVTVRPGCRAGPSPSGWALLALFAWVLGSRRRGPMRYLRVCPG